MCRKQPQSNGAVKPLMTASRTNRKMEVLDDTSQASPFAKRIASRLQTGDHFRYFFNRLSIAALALSLAVLSSSGVNPFAFSVSLRNAANAFCSP